MKKLLLSALVIGLSVVLGKASDDPFFHTTDSLAPRDGWGLLHQMPAPNATDFEPRYRWRPLYYLESGRELSAQPAYVGALQRDLKLLGYYCGPIDGVFSDDVSDAIARLQKNCSQRVTGTLTIPVRRVLHLP
jgi:Putative peptidoglycan binding domain